MCSHVPPCSQHSERALLEALSTDLNQNYMTSLATEFCTSREGQAGSCDDIIEQPGEVALSCNPCWDWEARIVGWLDVERYPSEQASRWISGAALRCS
jgi:hypothetical protein